MSGGANASGQAFLSYVREDSQAVDRLQRVLEAAGVRIWRDTADLWPGEDWSIRIREAIIDDALAFVACFSRNSARRDRSYQREELMLALEQLRQRQPGTPWLIPVRLDDCTIPDLDIGGGRTLGSIQRVDLFGDNADVAIARLVATVLRILGGHSDAAEAASRRARREAPASARALRASAGMTNSVSGGASRDDEAHLISLIVQVIQALPADVGERIAKRSYGEFLDNSEPSTSWPEGRDVGEDDLSLGDVLGAGGQGQVVRVVGPIPGLVYKKYHRIGQNMAALRRLLDLRTSLPPWSRQFLDSTTAWPLHVVVKNGTPCGFLMREVPSRFRGITSAGAKLRELQYLLYQPKQAWGDIVPPDIEGRIKIALQLATLIQFLHEHSVVVADLSMVNILWSASDPPEIFMIDCDAARLVGRSGMFNRIDTPGWADPYANAAGPDLEGDRYKLALAIGRILRCDPHVVPGRPLALPPGILETNVRNLRYLWSRAGASREIRPDAGSWVRALSPRRESDNTRYIRPGPGVLPFYFVCEESAAMAGTPIEAINWSLREVHDEVGSNPAVADRTRFCFIGFSDSAEVLLPLADLSTLTAVPNFFVASGKASYSSAFNMLYNTINDDVTKLQLDGHTVYRPAVFFVASSPSCDDWVDDLRRITDPSWLPHPNIISFGIGTAQKDEMAMIGTIDVVMGGDNIGLADVMHEYAELLTRSIVNSVETSQLGLSFPDQVPGFIRIDAAKSPEHAFSVPDIVPGFTRIDAAKSSELAFSVPDIVPGFTRIEAAKSPDLTFSVPDTVWGFTRIFIDEV